MKISVNNNFKNATLTELITRYIESLYFSNFMNAKVTELDKEKCAEDIKKIILDALDANLQVNTTLDSTSETIDVACSLKDPKVFHHLVGLLKEWTLQPVVKTKTSQTKTKQRLSKKYDYPPASAPVEVSLNEYVNKNFNIIDRKKIGYSQDHIGRLRRYVIKCQVPSKRVPKGPRKEVHVYQPYVLSQFFTLDVVKQFGLRHK